MESTTITTNTHHSWLKAFGSWLVEHTINLLKSPTTYLAVAGIIGATVSNNVMEHGYSATAKIGNTEFTLTKNQTQES